MASPLIKPPARGAAPQVPAAARVSGQTTTADKPRVFETVEVWFREPLPGLGGRSHVNSESNSMDSIKLDVSTRTVLVTILVGTPNEKSAVVPFENVKSWRNKRSGGA